MPIPLSTGPSAVFPYNEELRRQYVFAPVYEDDQPICCYRVAGEGTSRRLLLPRGFFPVGADDRRTLGFPIKTKSSFLPRSDEQERVVAESTALLKKDESHIICAPTGFGKTIVAAEIIHRVGLKTLVIVNKEDIRDQWFEAFEAVLGIPRKKIGLVQGDHVSYKDAPIVIALIQSVAKRGRYPTGFYQQFGMVIWDECHRLGAEHFSETAWLFPAKLRLGLSATPTRKDGRDVLLKGHIGPIRVRTTQMTVKARVYAQETGWRVPRSKDSTGREVQIPHKPARTGHITKIMAKNPQRNGLIAAFVLKAYRASRHTIVFSHQLAHLDNLHSLIMGVGVPLSDIAFYVGGMKKAEREAAKKKPVILATYGMASEATDIPRLDTAVLGTPRSDVIQIVGRILREHPDKKDPVVYDLVDSDSSVFKAFYKKRLGWYKSKTFDVKVLGS